MNEEQYNQNGMNGTYQPQSYQQPQQNYQQPQQSYQQGYQQQNYQQNGYSEQSYQQGYQPNYQPQQSYQQGYQQPQNIYVNVQTPNYGYMQSGEDRSEITSMGDWLITFLILCIPFVNIVMLFIWAFGDTNQKSKANYFKAYMLFMIVYFALVLIIYLGMFFFALASAGMANGNY